MSVVRPYPNMSFHRNFTLCTLCLSKEPNLLHVFDHKERGIQLPTVIRELLQFEVVQEGCIPWQICRTCFMKLMDFHHFKSYATKCKQYLDYTFLHGRRHLDSTFVDALPVTMETEENDDDEVLSNESFTVEDEILPKTEAKEDVPDRTEVSHPTQTATPVLKPVEVFVNVEIPWESGEALEEVDPLGGEDVEVTPSALITILDEGVSREEDGASSPTGIPFAFDGVKQEVGDDATEMSATTMEESSADWRSPNMTVVSNANVVREAVDGVDGFQEAIGAEKNQKGLIVTGRHTSVRVQQETLVPEVTISHWMERGVSSNSRDDGGYPNEGIGSTLHGISRRKCGERTERPSQRNAGMRIEIEEDSKTSIGDVSNGPLTGDGESEGDNLRCGECGKVFGSESVLRRHVKLHGGTGVLERGDCNLKFSERSERERHVSERHKSGACRRGAQSGLVVDESGESGGQGKIGKGIPPTCHICRKTFFNEKRLKIHVKTVHVVGKNFPCNICGKAFAQNGILKNHMKKHSGLKPYECGECHKVFNESGNLRKHIQAVHKMEKPHTCSECGKTFSQKGHLKTHMFIHTGERPHSCDICARRFTHKNHLKSHVLLHTKDRSVTNIRSQAKESPHTCDICSKTFAEKRFLTRHMSVHSGEKPYSCDLCSKAFCEKRRLTRHRLIHTGGRPFSCDLCSRTFRHQDYLKIHMVLHDRKSPHPCDHCTKTFISNTELQKHRAVHIGEMVG